jgi:hypothetical protein
MTVGLQIFDANGNTVLDGTYRVMRIGGSQSVVGGQDGTVVDNILMQGGWFGFQPNIAIGEGYLSGGMIVPRFAITGNVLTWQWAAKHSDQYDRYQEGIVFYGGS